MGSVIINTLNTFMDLSHKSIELWSSTLLFSNLFKLNNQQPELVPFELFENKVWYNNLTSTTITNSGVAV